MQTLESITKGNYNLEYTKKTFKHETNLRFHIKIGERFYEYAMDTINKKTINLHQKPTLETVKSRTRADQLSGPERKESLIEFLERFSRCDGIPPLKKYDFEQSSDTESFSESETE